MTDACKTCGHSVSEHEKASRPLGERGACLHNDGSGPTGAAICPCMKYAPGGAVAPKARGSSFADAKAVAESLGWELTSHKDGGCGTSTDYELKKGGVSARFHRRTAACTAWSVTVDGVELVDWRENAALDLPAPAHHPLDETVRRAVSLLGPERILQVVIRMRDKDVADLEAKLDSARELRNQASRALSVRVLARRAHVASRGDAGHRVRDGLGEGGQAGYHGVVGAG